MRLEGPRVVTVVVLSLALAAGLLLATDPGAGPRRSERGREFQQAVGGLGFGPALDLGTCAFAFDPRICPACPADRGPIPGGLYFCPHHAGSIFYLPQGRPGREPSANAPPP
jgi:hypothetical protein